MRKHLLAAIAVLCAAFAGCVCGGPRGAAPLRVGPYQIRTSNRDIGSQNAWDLRKEDLAAFVKGMDLDVLGLQEVRCDQDAFLRERFPEYEFVGERTVPGDDRMCAVPVAYRKSRFSCEKAGTFWLSETPDVKGSKSWDSSEPRVCAYAVLRDNETGRRFCFANTHMDHRGAVAREKGALLVVERMKDFGAGAPVVFVGDHNSNETEPAARSLVKILDNALYLSEKPPAGCWRTHNGWKWRDEEVTAAEALSMPMSERNSFSGSPDSRKKKGSTVEEPSGDRFYERCGGTRIDFIYVTPGTRVLEYATLDAARPGRKQYHSDHFPVVATIVLPDGAAQAGESKGAGTAK